MVNIIILLWSIIKVFVIVHDTLKCSISVYLEENSSHRSYQLLKS